MAPKAKDYFEMSESTVFCQEELLMPPSSAILQCLRCKELLKPPIYLLANQGNVCCVCYEQIVLEDSKELAIENKTLTMLLSKLDFQCNFKGEGCEKVLKYSDMLDHVKICPYKKVSCPFGNCKWQGQLAHLDIHFYDSCPGMAGSVHLKDKMVVFEGDLVSGNVGGIVYHADGTFIYRLKVVNNEAYLLAYCSTVDAELFVDFHFSKYIPDEKTFTNMEKHHCKTVNDIDELYNFNMAKAVTLGGDICIQPGQNPFTLLFSVNNVKGDWYEIKNKQLSVLLCESCGKYLKPPIYNCSTGASVCECCYVSRFQNRNKSITDVRNCILEKLTNYVTYPCKFCNFEFVLETDHELTCRYQKWSCEIDNCKYSGVWFDLQSHIIRKHSECIISLKNSHVFSSVFYDETVLIVYNTIFIFTWGSYLYKVRAVSIRTDVTFDFEIRFSLGNKSITFTNPCAYLGSNRTEVRIEATMLKQLFDDKLPTEFHVNIVKNQRK